MAIIGFLSATAAFLPYSIAGSVLPPPYQYAVDTADAIFGDDPRDAFNGTFGLSILAGPTANKVLVGPALSLLNDKYTYNGYALFPFGRMAKTVVKSVQRPQFAVDMLSGVPLMEVHNAIYGSKEVDEPDRVATIMASVDAEWRARAKKIEEEGGE